MGTIRSILQHMASGSLPADLELGVSSNGCDSKLKINASPGKMKCRGKRFSHSGKFRIATGWRESIKKKIAAEQLEASLLGTEAGSKIGDNCSIRSKNTKLACTRVSSASSICLVTQRSPFGGSCNRHLNGRSDSFVLPIVFSNVASGNTMLAGSADFVHLRQVEQVVPAEQSSLPSADSIAHQCAAADMQSKFKLCNDNLFRTVEQQEVQSTAFSSLNTEVEGFVTEDDAAERQAQLSPFSGARKHAGTLSKLDGDSGAGVNPSWACTVALPSLPYKQEPPQNIAEKANIRQQIDKSRYPVQQHEHEHQHQHQHQLESCIQTAPGGGPAFDAEPISSEPPLQAWTPPTLAAGPSSFTKHCH